MINKSKKFNKNEPIIEGFYYDGPFTKIFKALSGIFKAIGSIAKIFMKLPDIFIWAIDYISWLFLHFLNPAVWITDLIKTIFIGIKIVTMGILDMIAAFVRTMVNMVFSPIINGFWGDPKLSKLPNHNGEKMCESGDKKCYAQAKGTVPVPVLFATIILPPVGIFMEMGLKGWANILVTALLTLFFYFPGLIYALILLYC